MQTSNLQLEYGRMLNGGSEIDQMDSYSLVMDSGFKMLSDLRGEKYSDIRWSDANMIFQMSLLKMHSCRRLAPTFEYTNPYDKNFSLIEMREPLSIWNIVRSQFEAFCNFNHLFIYHTDENFQKMIYDLWVISGLKNRQNHETSSVENVRKKEEEKESIRFLEQRIISNPVYVALSGEDKQNVAKTRKNKDWKISITNGHIRFLGWQSMFENAGCTGVMKSGYIELSLMTHPSNVSVFKFREMFREKYHHSNTFFALRLSKMLGAFLISDYCTFSKRAKESFNSLPVLNQLVINSINSGFRGNKYKVNNVDETI